MLYYKKVQIDTFYDLLTINVPLFFKIIVYIILDLCESLFCVLFKDACKGQAILIQAKQRPVCKFERSVPCHHKLRN